MPVSVSYSALPSLAEYELVRADVDRQLPLRNLHWVRKAGPSTQRSIRTIQQLPLQLRTFDSTSDQIGLSLLERPYCHLLFVVCEDNEVYRVTLRAQIREWLDAVIARQNQEWLIVHVASSKSSGAKFYQRKGTVLDKIKADFNTEFSNKLKEAILTTFDTNVGLYEEDVRKADSQRQLQGWQYLPFFLQKEALADSYEAMGLIEETLIQYDELEASFFQALKEHNLAWFGKVGGLAPGDDSLALLSASKKAYRKQIQNNSITVFDFRIYMFARQAAMLSKLGRIDQLARRGAYFISTFARTLRENQILLGQNFVESWTFSACLNIVDEGMKSIESNTVDKFTASAFIAVKAELLELARKQLDKIGIGAGHLPLVHPFSMSINETCPDTPRTQVNVNFSPESEIRPPVTRKDLLDAIADRQVFDKLYIDLTNRAIAAYQTSGRKRSSLKLHVSLAALEDERERYSSAQKLYSHLPAHYVDLRWVKLESSLLSQCTRLQAKLEMSKERLLSTLALIRAGIEFGSKEWEMQDENSLIGEESNKDSGTLAMNLMKDVYDLSQGLSKDFAAIAFPTFSMRLGSDRGATAADEDGVTVPLIIKNLLPCTLKIDEVRLKFSSLDGEQIWFTCGTTELNAAADTRVDLFCPTAVSGRLSLELSQIRFSRIIFQYSHRPVSKQNLAPDPRNMPAQDSMGKQPTIYFDRDYQALDVFIEVPKAIHLDQDREFILCIAAGRNQINKAILKLNPPTNEISFQLAQTEIYGGQAKLNFSATDNSLLIESIPAEQVFKLSIPILGQSRDPIIPIQAVLEYFTSKRPSTRRMIKRVLKFPIALPLSVNVQDFFREDCLLSKFSVTTDGQRGLKVKSAVLEPVEGVTVIPCRSATAPTLTILPVQTANFLFKIKRERNFLVDQPLRLTLTYCAIEEQLQALTEQAVRSSLRETVFASDERWFLEKISTQVMASTNLFDFSISAKFDSLVFNELKWKQRAAAKFSQRTPEAINLVKKIYQTLQTGSSAEPESAWRTLHIPVDLPSLSILNLVQLETNSSQTEIGQPLGVKMIIRPTFAWSDIEIPDQLKLVYDVTVNQDDWLLSGRKRGEFFAKDGVESVVQLSLVPLRAGAIFLPSVVIQPLAGTSQNYSFNCETQHLNAATVSLGLCPREEAITVFPISKGSTFVIEHNPQSIMV